MASALIVKDDGLIYAVEVPEEPNWGDCADDSAMSKYYQALASAKESAVLVSSHNQAFFIIQDHFMPKGAKEFKLLPGIYPIKGLDWEVGSKCELWCSDCKAFDWSSCREKQVAILKESTPSYASQFKKGDQHIIPFLESRIKDTYNAIENGGSQNYPFDEQTEEELIGMKRAYSDVLTEVKKGDQTEQRFTIEDMRKAFEAGLHQGMGDTTFDEWLKARYSGI